MPRFRWFEEPRRHSVAMDAPPKLNPAQLQAVLDCDGPLQVIAGPGTGKTRVLSEKVVHLVQGCGFPAESILALTFTEKAAEEMAGRITAALAQAGLQGRPTVTTFHAFCLDLVRQHAERLGFDLPPRLIVGPLYVQYIAERLDHLVTDHTDLVGKATRFADALAKFTSRCHDEGLVDRDLAAEVDAWCLRLDPREMPRALQVRDLAASVPRLLDLQQREGVVSWGDLLTLGVRLLRDDPSARSALQARYRYVLVDEFQDNNRAQFDLVNLLAAGHRRVCVVGDEDQSIYRFRGARLDLLREFRDHWEAQPGARVRVVNLEENYRSTPAIIAAGQALIQRNVHRYEEKVLRRADRSTAHGAERVLLAEVPTEDAERRHVARLVGERLAGGALPGDVAILCRSLAHVPDLVNLLRRRGVPVEVVGGGGLFGNPVVRETFAWLKVLSDPTQDEAALYRVLSLRTHGLSHEDQRALRSAAKWQHIPLVSALSQVEHEGGVKGLTPEGARFLRGFLRAVRRFDEAARPQARGDLGTLVKEVLQFAGLSAGLRVDTARGRQDLAAVGALLQAVQKYQEQMPQPSLHGLLAFLDVLEDLGEDDTLGEPSRDPGTVKVMTVHQAKGREFPVVIVAGVGDRFPPRGGRSDMPRRFLDTLTLGDVTAEEADLEEERRVLYVALTRAQRELLLSTPRERAGKTVTPSTFHTELGACPHVHVAPLTEADVPREEAGAGRVRTREAAEARLHYLVSELGSHAEGERAEAALEEALRLLAALLADAMPDGENRGRIAARLRALGLPPALERGFARSDEPGGVQGPLSLSASTLNAFAECPRRFYYRVVAGIPEAGSGAAALRGIALHSVLEEFHRRHPRADPTMRGELMGLVRTWETKLGFGTDVERTQWLAKVEAVMNQYLREETARPGIVRAVEQHFELRLAPDVIVTGKMDRVDELPDGRVRVVDYKTGQIGSRPEYLRQFQMPLYALATQEFLRWPLHSVEVLGLGSVDPEKGDLKRQVLPWEDGSRYALTQERLAQVRADIGDIVQRVRKGDFEARPSEDACQFCAYSLLCDKAWGTQEPS